jgi:chromosome segregation ATPase
MIRGLFLLAAILLGDHAVADSVLPRLGPLPILAADGSVSGAADIPFGERLTILSQDGAILTVKDATGQEFQVRATDVVAAPKADLSLMQGDQLAGSATDRADLQLWESAFQLRVFLGGAGSNKFAPSMVVPAGTDLSTARLPVMSIDKVETSVGTAVTIVQALFPLLLTAIDPVGQGQGHSVELHVLVDGSDYARPFMLEKLRLLSRGLAEQPGLLGDGTRFTRQVLYESGAVRDDGEVSASGLRAEWAAEEASKDQIGLTVALSVALKELAEQFDPADSVTHLVLILAGPGLSDDSDAIRIAKEAGDSLAVRRAGGVEVAGVVLLQGTPEPNPANDAVLANLAGGAPIKLVDFGTEVFSQLSAFATAKADAPTLGSANPICEGALSGKVPCLVPINPARFEGLSSTFVASQRTNWVALPLWFVSETAPFDLVPNGFLAEDVHAEQADIRACNAIGYVWDVSNAACVPAGEEQSTDFYALLLAAQDEMASISSQKDSAQEELARQQADWQNEKVTLEELLLSMQEDRDAALVSIGELEAKVATQLAVLLDAQGKVSSQSDQLLQFSVDAQSMKEDLLAAHARADELSATIESRTAELQDATTRINALDQNETSINEALAIAQDQTAKLESTVDTLTQSLEEERTAKADLEAKTAQLEADFQEKISVETARSADLDTMRAALSQSLEDERANTVLAKANAEQTIAELSQSLEDERASTVLAKANAEQAIADLSHSLEDEHANTALVKANAEQVIADLEKRIKASEANSAALQAQISDSQATIATLQAAKNDLSKPLSNVEVKLIQPDWQNEKARLEGLLSATQQDRDAARASIAALEAKVAKQLTIISQAQSKVSSQADQLMQFAADAQSMKSDLLAAQARADELSVSIESRNAELQAATARIDALSQNETSINEALAIAQDQTAKLETTVDSLTQSLEEERTARADLETRTAQLKIDFEEKISLEAARSASLDTMRAALSQSLEDERAKLALVKTNAEKAIAELSRSLEDERANAALVKTNAEQAIADLSQSLEDERANTALVKTNAEQAIADLEKRIKASEANSATLQAKIDDTQATIATLQAAKNDLLMQVSIADAARLEAEQHGLDSDKKLAKFGNKVISLQDLLKENAQQLVEVSTTLEDERHANEEKQTMAEAKISQLNEQVANLAKTEEINVTLLVELNKAKSDLSVLQAKTALLSQANIDALSNFEIQSEKAQTDFAILQTAYDALARSNSAAISSLKTQFDMARSELASTHIENEQLTKENELGNFKIQTLMVKSNEDDAKLLQLNHELSVAREEMELSLAQSTDSISELQSQVASLTRTRGELSDRLAQLIADKNKPAATLPVDHDALANQVSALMLETTPSPQGVGLTEPKPFNSTDKETSLFADVAMKRPQPRPTDFLPIQSNIVSAEQSKPSAPAVANLTPKEKPVPDTFTGLQGRTLKASALNGCHFEWTGQAGTLVCP